MSSKIFQKPLMRAYRYLMFIIAMTFLLACSNSTPNSTIYLTYDDGPSPKDTIALLDVLERHDVKATFFVTGQHAEKYPEIVLRTFKAGHTIANHSYAHRNSKDMSYAEIEESYERTDEIIREITGQQNILFRAPFLSLSDDSIAFLCNTNRNSVGVDMSGKDWETQNPEEIIDNLFGDLDSINIKDGVILLHDGGGGAPGSRQGTVIATQMLIPMLKRKGFTFSNEPPKHNMQISANGCD